jgi:hypothetical protein
VQPGAVVSVNGDAQAFFQGRVVEMTGSHFIGPGLARFEGGLAIEAEQGLFGAPHSLGNALHEGPVAFGDLNVVEIDLGASGAADLLTVSGPLSFAGTLRLTALQGYIATPGDRFQLFSFNSSSGYFTAFDTGNLSLAQGLVLDTSKLYMDGTVSIQAVPEPAQWLLMLGGLASLLAAKRRRWA